MRSVDHLLKRRNELKKGIVANLDLLMGSVVKAPSHSGYYLTDKTEGKTVTRYVRKDWVQTVTEMTGRNRVIRKLTRELSKINWELLRRMQTKRVHKTAGIDPAM
jgi:hypothetical protein